jgi:hypothetical protein
MSEEREGETSRIEGMFIAFVIKVSIGIEYRIYFKSGLLMPIY